MSNTPVMQQYRRIKAQYEGMVLFFRMGDFYEMFYEDADLGSRVLGLTLTSRDKGTEPVPMAGFPAKAGDAYINRMIQQGYRVAICEQIQDPSEAVGIVERDVVRIVTPGTCTEDGALEEKSHNFLASITGKNGRIGLAWLDLSTGMFQTHEIETAKLVDEIARINPVECLIPEGIRDIPVHFTDKDISLESLISLYKTSVTLRPDWNFDPENAKRKLLSHFQVTTLEGYGCHKLKEGLGAAGAILIYLEETQKSPLPHIDRLEVYAACDHMVLDRPTLSCLEILRTQRDGSKKGTLLSVLDKTKTAMGGRLLSTWLSSPLTKLGPIHYRQQGVAEFYQKKKLADKLAELLESISDIERLTAKVACGRANARDLLSIGQSLSHLPFIRESMADAQSQILKDILSNIDTMDALTLLLQKSIHPDPSPGLKEGGIIREGYSQELDELHELKRSGSSWFNSFQAQQIEKTGIPSLKVGYNRIFGYYIEITNTHAHKVPPDYIRKQTLKNAERYITPELKEYEASVLSADERANTLEYEIFLKVREEVSKYIGALKTVASALASLDCLLSLAQVATANNYVQPVLTEGRDINIVKGRHPVLEICGQEPFVPNDLRVCDDKDILIITGPNMAGKSTYIRQVAISILMAQIGSFVPAQSAQIGIVDRIFTRIGSGDEIVRGLSTFMIEMIETANILHNATEKSIIVLDEVGRGTSTFDGLSLAWAITEYIQEKLKARTLFATHYHEMTALSMVYPNVVNYNVAVQEWGEEIVFLRKIVEGASDKSYGVHVARLAGVPRKVIKRGMEILTQLEKQALDIQGKLKPDKKSPQPKMVQMNLFNIFGQEIIDKLQSLDLNNLTPLQVVEKMRELQEDARAL